MVGLNIQRLRREQKLSQEELSFRSGRTRAYLSGLEAGRRNATLLTLEQLARALGVGVIDLFREPPDNGRLKDKRKRNRANVGPKRATITSSADSN